MPDPALHFREYVMNILYNLFCRLGLMFSDDSEICSQVAVRMGQAFAEKLGQLGAVGTLVELFTDKDNPMTSRQMCASILATMCKELPCPSWGHRGTCETSWDVVQEGE